MTLVNKLKAIVDGQLHTLTQGDVRKIVNYIKAQNREIRRLAALKGVDIEIDIVE